MVKNLSGLNEELEVVNGSLQINIDSATGLNVKTESGSDILILDTLTGKLGINRVPQLAIDATRSNDGEAGMRIQNSNTGTNAYTIFRLSTDTANDFVIYKNSSARTVDGGINSTTVRNDGGALKIQAVGSLTLKPAAGANVIIDETTSSLVLPKGDTTTAPVTGSLRYNTSLNKLQVFTGSVFETCTSS